MENFETQLIDVINRTNDVKSFRFKAGTVDFKPGQFFFVTINVEGTERTKHFSFSNSPTEKGYLEFTKRITASPFSAALAQLKPGDRVRLKMPFGSFTFGGEYDKIALLSGGIGITPLRSICKFATDKTLDTDIVLLYGNDTEGDIIFRNDFDDMQKKNKKLRAVYTLTSGKTVNGKWEGRRGYINDIMIKEEIPDFAERVFYICGPPLMVSSLTAVLNSDLGIKADRIRLERFTGY
ncbi:MAG: FAD-dependent oxidoreductase [Candidatus Omnitrophica bacterium]|nr:FAD-dependent oxidoreductase [Candidatus Omnitrophota bacterium]